MNLPSHAPLTGAALHDFLDETESALELQQETGVSDELRQSTLAALMARQAFKPDDLQSLSRLHRLWLQAGRPEQALRVLQDDGALLVEALPAEDRAEAGMRLVFWRIETALVAGPGTPALPQGLDEAERALLAEGAGSSSFDDWSQLADLSAQAGDQARARRCTS